MYEYKFVKVKYVGMFDRKLEDYQKVITEHAQDGWRFATSQTTELLDNAPTGVTLVFEKEKTDI